MNKVTRTKNIKASAGDVWNVIVDFGNVHNHNPFVKSADLLQKKDRGIGIKRRCHFYDGTSLVEEIKSWDKGKRFSVDLSEASCRSNTHREVCVLYSQAPNRPLLP